MLPSPSFPPGIWVEDVMRADGVLLLLHPLFRAFFLCYSACCWVFIYGSRTNSPLDTILWRIHVVNIYLCISGQNMRLTIDWCNLWGWHIGSGHLADTHQRHRTKDNQSVLLAHWGTLIHQALATLVMFNRYLVVLLVASLVTLEDDHGRWFAFDYKFELLFSEPRPMLFTLKCFSQHCCRAGRKE